MADLPSGTITFLFTDIEGSTRRWEKHPEVMSVALARHDDLLRGAIEAQGGYVFKTMGDAFCAAFATAPDALGAAVNAQVSLQVPPTGEDDPLRVRMALHTGTAAVRDGDYFGPPLNRVARLLATGHGGQILLSRTAYDLVRDMLPDEVSLRDLGEHRLRDLQRPEHVFQLLHPHLPMHFPPLKTLDYKPNNLPAQPTPLIGRERAVEELRVRVLRDDARLLTLTGPGGMGKTRLGLQVAADLLDEFADGVFFVNLAPVSDPAAVASITAGAVGMPVTGGDDQILGEPPQEPGSRRGRGQPPLERLKDYLRHKQLLLVLDNFEQVVVAAPLVAGLLAACPGLKTLVTSRTPLHLRGEQEFPLTPLELPDMRQLPPVNTISQYAAVALFIERATEVQPAFVVTNENAPAVAEICHRLDGLPLAIELAAAKSKLLPPQAMLARLAQRLPLLTGGARDLPARQQTLRATLDWSYELLDAGEQTLFQRLAIFSGGWPLEAAEAVCTVPAGLEVEILETLGSLVDKSLLRQEGGTDAEPRFVMLETVREYARERLAQSEEAETLGRAHAAYYRELAAEGSRQFAGPQQAAWLERLEREHDNLRGALRWCVVNQEAGQGLQLGGALWQFWSLRDHDAEGRAWLTQLLALPAATARTGDRARALNGAAALADNQGDYAASRTLLEESLVILREFGEPGATATALFGLGRVAFNQDDHAGARALLQESLDIRRRTGDSRGIAMCLRVLGNVANDQGDLGAAAALWEESLGILRQSGGNSDGLATTLTMLGRAAVLRGDYAGARPFLEEGLAVRRELGTRRGIAQSLNLLGEAARAHEDYDRAKACYEESLVLYREVGAKLGLAATLHNLGHVALYRGNPREAAALFGEGLVLGQELGRRKLLAECLAGLAGVAARDGQAQRAARLFGAAETLLTAPGGGMDPVDRREHDRNLEIARGGLDERAFAAAWAEGQAMSGDQAIAYGLP